ncbi:MAG: hypothetical protein ACXVOI_07925 [Tumebacillaceae bacterium]
MLSIGARNLFAELDASGENNAVRQTIYALTGFFLLYVLTVMKTLHPMVVPGLVVLLDSLLFLYCCSALNRKHEERSLVSRYYQSGFGLYLSVLFQILFFAATLLFLFL